MNTMTLERNNNRAELHEYQRPAPEALAERSRLMNEAGIPLPAFEWPGAGTQPNLWQEYARADVNPGNTFKVRGALSAAQEALKRGAREVVTASAGNHALGLANAARKLGLRAKIFMPATTPRIKIDYTKRLGGDNVEIDTTAQSFDEARLLAESYEHAEFLSAYDNLDVIAGQGTAAYETLMARPQTDKLFVAVGGGGLLAGTLEVVDVMKEAGLVKQDLKIVAVMYQGNDSLAATLENNGVPAPATGVDSFCEGTAVEQIGKLPAALIWKYREHLELETVSEFELAKALAAYETHRASQAERGFATFPVPETTGLLAMAGAGKRAQARTTQSEPEDWLSMVTGSNADPDKLDRLRSLHTAQKREQVRRGLGTRACLVASGR